MNCITTRIPYRLTNSFSQIVLDYLEQPENLQPFYSQPPVLEGIKNIIAERKKIKTDRKLLADELKKQYNGIEINDRVKKNIYSLVSENTFSITTAHQPNIFTGPLFFIYKILHVIKLAEYLNKSLPENLFIPVYYMGSEDADLEELGHCFFAGEKFTWNTRQTGAVGRMKVDKELLKLVGLMEGQLGTQVYGKEILLLIKNCYKEGRPIQDATFDLVNALFGEYGLVVLIPDNAALKKQMAKVFEDDLLHQAPSEIVDRTAAGLQDAGYKQQANPREINLFYLVDGVRERITKKDNTFYVQNSTLSFSESGIIKELNEHPERFSPNVILRGLYQETILPDAVYVGGGGEIAYWLQYKELFKHYATVFPVLLLRNSYLLIEKKWQEKIEKLGFTAEDFFQPVEKLLNKIVERESRNKVKLNGVYDETEKFYEQLKKQAVPIDISLGQHIDALKARSIHRLQELEKKMLRAEKRKFTDQQRQIQTIKDKLFPRNSLQERIDNFIPYYAKWGKDFINKLYEFSLGLEQEFVIIKES